MAPTIYVSDKTLKGLNSLGVEYSLIQEQVADLDTSNWIVMPEDFNKRGFKTSVDPARISYNPAVEKAGKSLALNLKNTSKDSLGREFVGDINWRESMKLVNSLGTPALPLNQGMDFLNLLYQGMQGKIDVYTEAGKKLDSKYLENIFEDITKVQSPGRAEWLDANFTFENEKLCLNTGHDENLKPSYKKVLTKNTLMEDKRVSLPSLLETKTKQGLPSTKTESGHFYTWAPMKDNNSVAGFYADSVRAILDCVRYPSDRYSDLGVRAAKQHE